LLQKSFRCIKNCDHPQRQKAEKRKHCTQNCWRSETKIDFQLGPLTQTILERSGIGTRSPENWFGDYPTTVG